MDFNERELCLLSFVLPSGEKDSHSKSYEMVLSQRVLCLRQKSEELTAFGRKDVIFSSFLHFFRQIDISRTLHFLL
jgi:hypothetical protein